MESGAQGVEVIVSGKARVQRAKSMKFKSGFLITTGKPAQMFIDKATRHVMMKQGVLGERAERPYFADDVAIYVCFSLLHFVTANGSSVLFSLNGCLAFSVFVFLRL